MKLTINKHTYGETPDNIEKDRKSLKNLGVHYAEIFEYTEDKKTKKNQQLENIETVVLNSTQNSKCLNFISYLKRGVNYLIHMITVTTERQRKITKRIEGSSTRYK